MAKIHAVVHVFQGCAEDVYLFEDIKAAKQKLAEIQKDLDKETDDAQLFRDVEITEVAEPKFSVVKFRGDVAVDVLFSDIPQKEAAKITHRLNMGMREERRAQGYHFEMKQYTPPGTPSVDRAT